MACQFYPCSNFSYASIFPVYQFSTTTFLQTIFLEPQFSSSQISLFPSFPVPLFRVTIFHHSQISRAEISALSFLLPIILLSIFREPFIHYNNVFRIDLEFLIGKCNPLIFLINHSSGNDVAYLYLK